MAFNPIKKQTETPVYEQNQNPSNQNNDGSYDFDPTYTNEPSLPEVELKFEGHNVSDLEQSGIHTIELLKVASQNVTDKVRFNVPLLESLPLEVVLAALKATKIKDNLFKVNDQEISIKENKWYNKTQRFGNLNPISLVKHLIALEEGIDPLDNQKTLFIAACKKLTKIQERVHSNDNIMDQAYTAPENTEVNETPKNLSETTPNKPATPEAKQKPDFVYTPSDAVKEAQDKSVGARNNQKIDWKMLTEQLNNIPLNLVMEHIGANPNEDGQRGKWKIWKTGHNMQITGQQWHSWNAQRGGFGGISLLAFQLGIENNIDDRNEENKKYLRKLAIKELIKVFGTEYNLNSFGGEKIDTSYFKEPFSMPHVIDFKINQVRQYLNEKRGLPMWVINKQIKAGSLFAGYPSDWKEEPNLQNPEKLINDKVWATFLAVNGNAAEMRAIERTDQFAKILAKGSDKELGGFLIKAEKDCSEKTVVSCEAAIDTMSYHALYPGRIVSSCMGVNFNLAVKSAIESLDHGYKYQFAFDNDLAGNEAAVRFREQLINEIGEEEYQENYKNGNISYFDLGVRCLKKTVEKGGIFYFDVKHDDIGRQAAILFQEQLYKIMSKENVKELAQKGKIKYANVAPAYGLLNDEAAITKEAEKTLSLLMSNKKLYILLKQGDDDEKDEVKQKREFFEKEFQRLASVNFKQLLENGQIIYKKQAFAKDWNEFFIVMKKEPRFIERLQNLEEKYSHYNQDVNPTKKNDKKP